MSPAGALWLAVAAAAGAPPQDANAGWQYVPPPAAEQQGAAKHAGVRRHDGLFIRPGLGVSLLHSRGRTDIQERLNNGFSPAAQGQTRMRAVSGPGVVAHASIGGTPVAGLVFAFELTSHMYWDLDVETEEQPRVLPTFSTARQRDAKYLSYGLLALWYPDPTLGFNAGLSLAFASAHENGPAGWFAGPQLGYEWWIGEQWSIGAVLKASFSGLSDGQGGGFSGPFVGGDSAYVAMPSLSAVVTFH